MCILFVLSMHNDLHKLCSLVVTVICCLVASNKFNQATKCDVLYASCFIVCLTCIIFISLVSKKLSFCYYYIVLLKLLITIYYLDT